MVTIIKKYYFVFIICIGIASLGFLGLFSFDSTDIEPVQAQGFNYVIDDFTFYPTPDLPKPAKGESYIDPYFNTTITRVIL